MEKCPICNKSYLKLETKGVDSSVCPKCEIEIKAKQERLRESTWQCFEARWETK